MNEPRAQLPTAFDLESLARSIQSISGELSRQASRAVNVSLTVRNWLIGHYIAEFELKGSDRASLLYERSELSLDREKLSELTDESAQRSKTGLTIRDPYVFEFLGLTSQEVMGESQLEDQLLDRLQYFLLELGQGFCFEARQRRILIGATYNFVDLVFYHRILKCHVLVELKLEEFSHENIGQLNTYVSWYDRNVRSADDNPPVGILLCTDKDHALVEYALAGMDNSLFVSKYQLELPSREVLQQQIEAERQRLEGIE